MPTAVYSQKAQASSSSSSAPTTYSPQYLKKVMEQFRSQAGQQVQQMSQQASSNVERARNWLIDSIQNAADTLREYVNRYPPLAAFLFTLLVLAAVPLGIFVLFGLITSSIFLSIALVGFGVVEGFCLMAGGAVLMTTLGGIGLVTTIAFAWVGVIYAFYKGGSSMFGRISESAGYISQRTQETLQQMQQQPSTTTTPGMTSSPLTAR